MSRELELERSLMQQDIKNIALNQQEVLNVERKIRADVLQYYIPDCSEHFDCTAHASIMHIIILRDFALRVAFAN